MSVFLERYSLLLILLFCMGLMEPQLAAKISLVDTDLDVQIADISSGSILKQVLWGGLFLFFLAKHCLNTRLILQGPRFQVALLLLLLICLVFFISALWSSYPAVSIKRTIFQLIFVFTVMSATLYCYQHGLIGKNIKYAAYSAFFMLAVTVVLGTAFHPSGDMVGYAKGKNALGMNMLCLVLMLTLFYKSVNEKLRNTSYLIAIALVVLLLSQSKTSMFILLLFALLTLLPSFTLRLVMASLFVSFVTLFIIFPSYMHYFGSMDTLLGIVKDESLTGRGFIWNTLYYDLHYFDKFGLGYGYGSYFGVSELPYFFDNRFSFLRFISSTHNGYLDMLLHVGTVLSLCVMCVFFKLANYIKDKYFFAALILPVVHNFTESSVVKDDSMVWFFMIFIISYSCIKGDCNAKNRLAG
jgi:exopolysaccharide production protein ExoQ